LLNHYYHTTVLYYSYSTTMKFILNVISLLAVGSVSASQQQEVQHRLRGGVPASTKNVEERRLEDAVWNATSSSTSSDYSNVATDMNTTSSSDSSDMEDTAASSGDCASITDTVCAMEDVTVFCELLKNPSRRHLEWRDTNSTSTDEDTDAVAMSSPTGASSDGTEDFASAFGFDDESEVFTLFVPTDAAFAEISEKFETLSDAEAGRVIMFHMYSGMMLTSDKLACSETITSMNEMSDASRTKCKNDGKKYQNGNGNTKTGSMPEIDTADHMACNGVIHTLDHVMFPVSLSQLHADDA